MSKLKLESQIFERFDEQAQGIVPAMEQQANQVVSVLAKDLIGADFKPNMNLNGIHEYSRPESYIFWQKIGNLFNDFVKQKPWLSSLKITPISDESKSKTSDFMAHYVGGNTLFVGAAALMNWGSEGRMMKSLFEADAMAGYLQWMHVTMDKLHMGWFGTTAAAGVLALGLVSAKVVWEAKTKYTAANFEAGREQAIANGENAQDKTFLQRCKALFSTNYLVEPDVSKNSLNRIVTMQKLNVSTENILKLTQRKDEPAFKHIERTAKTLHKHYLVEPHLTHQMALGMIVEMKGDTNHLTAILASRHLPQGWTEKFGIDPKTIVKEEPRFKAPQMQIEHQRSPAHQDTLAM